ncbi:GNAT family protein [Paenibacillus senegalensis]|uniref:N-acetyltransferase n=1 Tax=Paenibacillus senegalensis TaxID=1465766 RepID=UPI00028A1317|nr:N-acetyltransferase [Paenibacillus senegalensis]
MESILPSPELIAAIEQSEKDYMKDRMEAIQNRQGNPEGVEIAYFGNAMCIYSKTMPWPAFNTVKGFSSADLDYIDEIINFYRRKHRKVQFEIVPSRVDKRTLEELNERGLYQSGFHTSLYCSPVKEKLPALNHVQIKEVKEEDFAAYATIHCRGTGLPDDGIPYVAENNRILYHRPGWKFYIAYVANQPAAAGVMYSRNRICSLTFAATLPEYRKQGLHKHLLKTRLNESANQKCEWVVGQCAFLSQSHRNMESVGMRLGYVRTTWTER